jgi:hypothetical protein
VTREPHCFLVLSAPCMWTDNIIFHVREKKGNNYTENLWYRFYSRQAKNWNNDSAHISSLDADYTPYFICLLKVSQCQNSMKSSGVNSRIKMFQSDDPQRPTTSLLTASWYVHPHSSVNPLTHNDLQRCCTGSPLKIKVPSKNMPEKSTNTPMIHSVY